MSKCVVDTNYLRSRKLHDFLARSPTNVAGLTDYSAMEAHPGEATLITIFKSMEIVSEFPHQVIILRNSSFASRLKGSSRGLQRRLIDEKATRGFPKYCSMLKRVKSGDFGLQQELLQQGHISARHLDNIRATAESANFRERLRAVADLFSANDLGIVHRKEPLSDAMIDKLASGVVRVALDGFAEHRISKPPAEEPKHFCTGTLSAFAFFHSGGRLMAPLFQQKLRSFEMIWLTSISRHSLPSLMACYRTTRRR
jgi:hypothetical protein